MSARARDVLAFIDEHIDRDWTTECWCGAPFEKIERREDDDLYLMFPRLNCIREAPAFAVCAEGHRAELVRDPQTAYGIATQRADSGGKWLGWRIEGVHVLRWMS